MIRLTIKAWIALLLTLVVCTVTQAEIVTHYHNNHLGSVIAATDANGNLLYSEEYEAFGNRLLQEGNGQNDIWFAGKPEESEFNIQYFGARWYDPDTGLFLSRDPVGYQANNVKSFHKYIYANNNPYKYIDPDGRFPLLALLAPVALGSAFSAPANAPDVGETTQADSIVDMVSAINPVTKTAAIGFGIAKAGGKGVAKSGKSLKDQAADLVPANGNKNRVTLRSENQQLEIDLAGKDHAGIPTPHTKVSPRNHNAPERLQPAYNTSEKKSTLRPSTQEDIRTARRYLERQNQ